MSERLITSGDNFVPGARDLNKWNRAADPAALLHGGDRGVASGDNPALALVRNDTGSTLERFSVVKATEPLTSLATNADRYKSKISFKGESIDEDDEPRFAIVQTQLQADRIDPFAVVAGVTHVRLVGPTGKTNATPKAGETTLEASDNGPCVIMHDPGPADEERIARVRIGGGSSGSGGSSGGGGSSIDCGSCNQWIEIGAVEIEGVGPVPMAGEWSNGVRGAEPEWIQGTLDEETMIYEAEPTDLECPGDAGGEE